MVVLLNSILILRGEMALHFKFTCGMCVWAGGLGGGQEMVAALLL